MYVCEDLFAHVVMQDVYLCFVWMGVGVCMDRCFQYITLYGMKQVASVGGCGSSRNERLQTARLALAGVSQSPLPRFRSDTD